MSEVALHIPPNQSRINHSKKFALYLAIASMVMLFAAFTSAYVVRKSAGNWLEFILPVQFIISTGVILLSSLTAHLAYKSFTHFNRAAFRRWALISLVLGITFVVLQYYGWLRMVSIGVPLDGNPSGSFIYVISGFHVAHVLGGLAAWFLVVRSSFTSVTFSERRRHNLELVTIYWHFVDALWVYLLIFFILQ